MNRILFTYPGQGAQIPGMLHSLSQTVPCQTWFDKASEALGEDVMVLDTEVALKRTRAVQLCILIAGVVMADRLIQEKMVPDFVGGLSIGAFPAAVTSGALDFTDALKVVSLRGELMESAYPDGYGLSAISGLIEKDVQILINAVNTPDNPVFLANYNATDQFVIAGSETAMQAVLEKAREKGATRTDRLAVAVPSHCPLLGQAAQKLFEAIRQVPFKRPAIAYLSGSTGRVLWQPERIADDLAFNMARPLYWANAMTAAYERGVRLAVEMPPGSVLTGLAKRVMTEGDAVSIQQEGFNTVLRLGQRKRTG